MPDSDLTDRMVEMEQRQQRQDQVVAQVHEILLMVAQRQDRTAAQQEINTRAIGELQAILRARLRGNGQANS